MNQNVDEREQTSFVAARLERQSAVALLKWIASSGEAGMRATALGQAVESA